MKKITILLSLIAFSICAFAESWTTTAHGYFCDGKSVLKCKITKNGPGDYVATVNGEDYYCYRIKDGGTYNYGFEYDGCQYFLLLTR